MPDQPIFYPVLNFDYAEQIANGWNTRYNDPPCGFITKFEGEDTYVSKFKVETVSARIHQELWVPAEELEEFNSHIVGNITIEVAYYGKGFKGEIDKASSLPLEITNLK